MVEDASRWRQQPVPEFAQFTLDGAENAEVLHPRRLRDEIFLCTVEGGTRIIVEPNDELPFDEVANDPRVSFRRLGSVWRIELRDPRLERGV
jgi:hypothetical protein